MKTYISGPMTGIKDFNYPLFNEVENYLVALGFDVENPAKAPRFENWSDYMRHDLKKMMDCEIIAMLPGWERSKGAMLEKQIADALNFGVVFIFPHAEKGFEIIADGGI